MAFDFNDGDRQRSSDVIPNGTLARVVGIIRPGGISRPGMEAADAGYLTASTSSDVLYLSWEFTILEGPFARRKFWQNMTVHGGTTNEKGESKAWNITKSTVRALLNGARGIMPDDESDAAKERRRINSWADLNGIEFGCKIRVNPPKDGYQASNQIGMVIEPDSKDYAAVSGGGSSAAAPAASWSGTPAAQLPKPSGAAVPAWAR